MFILIFYKTSDKYIWNKWFVQTTKIFWYYRELEATCYKKIIRRKIFPGESIIKSHDSERECKNVAAFQNKVTVEGNISQTDISGSST